MIDSAIQALIDAARTGDGDLVTWAELKEILEALKGQTSLTDLSPTEGQVAKYVSGSWTAANDESGAGASKWTDAGTYIYPTNGEKIVINDTPESGLNWFQYKETTSGASESLIEYLKPYNFGTVYSGGTWGTAAGFIRGFQLSGASNPVSSRPNVTITTLGYNSTLGGGRVYTGEARWQEGLETNYDINTEAFFERHYGNFTPNGGGGEFRLYSIYCERDGGGATHNFSGTQFSWGEWNNDPLTQEAYFSGNQGGQFNFRACDGASGAYISIGTAGDADKDIAYMESQDARFVIGHIDVTDAQSQVLTQRTEFINHVWIGQLVGYGGGVNQQRALLLGGYQITENQTTGRDALLVTQPASRERVAYIGTSDSDYTIIINKAGAQLKAYGNYTNDANAASGGVPVGGIYRNGSALQIRVT
jgi:hypothetical protein